MKTKVDQYLHNNFLYYILIFFIFLLKYQTLVCLANYLDKENDENDILQDSGLVIEDFPILFYSSLWVQKGLKFHLTPVA